MNFRQVLAVAVVAVLVGGVTFAGSQRRTEILRFSDGPYDEFLTSCGSFDIYVNWAATIRLTVRRDKSGTEVQTIQHYIVTDSVYYNSDDPGMYVEGTMELNNARIVGDVWYFSGAPYRVKVPGSGLVFRWTGHWAYNAVSGEFEAVRGKSDLLEGNFSDLCKALTPR
jgi:hypothetical protein